MLDEKKIREQYDTEIKNLEIQRDYLLNKIKVLDKCRNDVTKGNINLEELNSLLCWHNLAYCCRPKGSDGGKNCMWRTTVLNILGISENDFIKTKEEATNIFYSKIEKKE